MMILDTIFKHGKVLDKVVLYRPFFNIIAHILAIIINRAKEDGQIEGLIPHLVEGGVSILQYADDTILFT
jgi:hypothetical protein